MMQGKGGERATKMFEKREIPGTPGAVVALILT